MESSNQGTEGETNSRQQTLEKETIKKTTVKTKIEKLIENSREKKQQEELPGHRNIRKSMRRRDVIVWISLYVYRIVIVSYNC
jgi:hypothetical protein